MGYPGRHNIYEATIRRMVLAALEAQELRFRQEHEMDTDEELLDLLRDRAAAYGYIPWPGEMAGRGYLYEEGLIGSEVFSISGGVGSSFMNQFWGGDCNLNYYVNYEYPLASDGWGATADQILLRDGDIITLGHFTGWSFYADPYSIFNYITADNENPVRGEEITLTLYYAGADLGATGGTAQNLNTRCLDVYYAPVDDIPSEDVTD